MTELTIAAEDVQVGDLLYREDVAMKDAHRWLEVHQVHRVTEKSGVKVTVIKAGFFTFIYPVKEKWQVRVQRAPSESA